MTPSNAPTRTHLLTVLVEDYFHVGAFEDLIHQRNWGNFEPRYEQNTLKTLDLLDEYGTKATFFTLGWIADQNPGLMREIVDRGHEIASRGYYHRSLKNLTEDEFREDLRRTNAAIARATGQKVVGFRAAEKLTYNSDWILPVLIDEGFAYDASFLPSVGTPAEKRAEHQVHIDGKAIWEYPYCTRDLGLWLMPISGGNYFRQIPYTLMRHAVRDWHRKQDAPFVSYFHVWELDPEQPRISAASRMNRVRHYRKLDKMEWVIRENLQVYDCIPVAKHLGLLEAETTAAKTPDVIEIASEAPSTVKTGKPVTVVIPCYNEAEALPYLANTLPRVEQSLADAGYSASFCFVNDKSTDTTSEMLDELFAERNNVSIIHHDVNKGVAAGIMTGLKAAKTEIVCSMDCDCTYDPLELASMIRLMGDDVDMVTASPYHREGSVRNVPAWRLTLSKGASMLYRKVLDSDLRTFTSCFRVYRRDSVKQLELEEPGFLGVAELLGKLDLDGGKIVEYPAVLEVRLFGFSKMKTLRTVVGHLSLLARLARIRFFRNRSAIKPSIQLEEKAR